MRFLDDNPRLLAIRVEDLLVLGAVVLLPWAFGGVELWAFRPAALLLVSAAVVLGLRQGWKSLLPAKGERWLWAAFLLALWASFQLLPLPPNALGAISPGAYRIHVESTPWYPGTAPDDPWETIRESTLQRVPEAADVPVAALEAGASLRPESVPSWPRWRPLSLHPSATQERLFWFLALLAGFLVVRRRVQDPDVFRVYRVAMFALFSALAFAGIAQTLHWNGKVLWIRESLYGGRPMGPYVNATHFGGVMELAAPWLAGYAWMRLRIEGWQALKKAPAPLAIGASGICAAAGFLTASKMVAVSLVLCLSLLALIGLRRWKNRLIALGGLAATWSLILFALFRTRLGERVMEFLETSGHALTQYDRIVVWKASVPMFREFPFTGVGFGTFRQVFPGYMPAGESGQWLRVHNDYLEVLLEGGLVAGLLLAWLVVGFWFGVASRKAGLRISQGIDMARVGLILGLVALSAHAAVDFNHQIPANALIFVAAAGILLGGEEADPGRGKR